MTNQELARFLEDHRKHTLEEVGDDKLVGVVGHAHDRATTRALLAAWAGTGSNNPLPNQALPLTIGTSALPSVVVSRRIKPGSKRAKDRAAKAGVTRAANLARKRAEAAMGTFTPVTTPTNSSADDAAKLSPATHLTPISGGGVA